MAANEADIWVNVRVNRKERGGGGGDAMVAVFGICSLEL